MVAHKILLLQLTSVVLLGLALSSLGTPLEGILDEVNVRTPLPPISVHRFGHYLQTENGQPFFWLGDTAWELIHRTTREECSYYLKTRADQGFTVIQTVALAEIDGIRTASSFGEKPFVDDDPTKPNDKYFDRVIEIVDEAASQGLYVALLPTWGDKLTAPWGVGPRIFPTDHPEVARGYARYLGHRLRERTNVVWMLGGDRPPKSSGNGTDSIAEDWTPVWRELARGIQEGLERVPVILYHPSGGPETSSFYLHDEPWLSINGMQSGHGMHDVPVWEWVQRDFELTPHKPTLDLEPNYEDHPVNPWPKWNPATGYFRDHDVRRQLYRSVFAGACGVTYGHHAVWQFAGARFEPINFPDRDWVEALKRPAATQVRFLKELMLSRPYFERIPDPALVVANAPAGIRHLEGTRDTGGTYAFIYFPTSDLSARIDLGRLAATRFRAWWFDPRTGIGTKFGEFDSSGEREFCSPSHGPDWVLVLDDIAAKYGPPGLSPALR